MLVPSAAVAYRIWGSRSTCLVPLSPVTPVESIFPGETSPFWLFCIPRTSYIEVIMKRDAEPWPTSATRCSRRLRWVWSTVARRSSSWRTASPLRRLDHGPEHGRRRSHHRRSQHAHGVGHRQLVMEIHMTGAQPRSAGSHWGNPRGHRLPLGRELMLIERAV